MGNRDGIPDRKELGCNDGKVLGTTVGKELGAKLGMRLENSVGNADGCTLLVGEMEAEGKMDC